MMRNLCFVFILAITSRAEAVLLPISDEFDNSATIANWNRINVTEGWNADQLQQWNIDTAQPGRMVMQPYAVTWYQNYRGPLVYQTLSGNFALTTQVEVRNGMNLPVRPNSSYSLAGVMLRGPRNITNPATDWAPGGEDFVFLSLGFGSGSAGPQFEVKTTNNSVSNLELTEAQGLTATLQLARLTNDVGTFVIALMQEPGDDWHVHRRFRRDDMAGTLQAGLVTYSDYGTVSQIDPYAHNGTVLTPGNPLLNGTSPHPDLIGGFEYARYFDLGVLPPSLQTANLLNTTLVSDAMLLSILGAGAAPEPIHTGDFDGDGDTDGSDFLAWQAGFGTASNAIRSEGDANGDGMVDAGDLSIWQSQYGEGNVGTDLGNAASVPEPEAVALLGIGILSVLIIQRNRLRIYGTHGKSPAARTLGFFLRI